MTTFLWMLYLAFTLLLTGLCIYDLKYKIMDSETINVRLIFYSITAQLWSIWYFYYLH